MLGYCEYEVGACHTVHHSIERFIHSTACSAVQCCIIFAEFIPVLGLKYQCVDISYFYKATAAGPPRAYGSAFD